MQNKEKMKVYNIILSDITIWEQDFSLPIINRQFLENTGKVHCYLEREKKSEQKELSRKE